MVAFRISIRPVLQAQTTSLSPSLSKSNAHTAVALPFPRRRHKRTRPPGVDATAPFLVDVDDCLDEDDIAEAGNDDATAYTPTVPFSRAKANNLGR